ncbi:MAG: molybdopterin-dependent oxidoreductase, partial [Acidimicrobiales bacterium]
TYCAGIDRRYPDPVSPDAVRSSLYQLMPGEDVITPATWAGSVPEVGGIAPRVRIGRSRWFNLLWLLPIGFVALIAAVAVAKGLRDVPSVQRFIAAQPLTFGHGAPLRLRNEIELGFKQVKWLAGIEFVAHFSDVAGGFGGYNQDHEFFGYRQSI